jgi:hypothetical protein
VIRQAFSDFITHQLSTLKLQGDERIVFTGKVAEVHSELLKKVMADHGYKNVEVIYPVITAWRARLKGG